MNVNNSKTIQRISLILLIPLFSCYLQGQQTTTIVFPSKDTININIDTITKQHGLANFQEHSIQLPFKPKCIDFDTINNNLIILSKSNHSEYNILYSYNITNNKIVWKLNTQANKFILTDSLLYTAGFDREFMIDQRHGKVLWQKKRNLYYTCYPENNHAFNIPGGNIIRLTDLSSGKTLWESKASKIHGINDYKYINDSIVLLAINGLYRINVLNGSYNHIDMKTSQNANGRYIGDLTFNSFTIMLGEQLPIHGVLGHHKLSSNILLDSNYIYIADNNFIYKISNDNDFNILWKKNIKDRKIGVSYFYKQPSDLTIFNTGSSLKAGHMKYYNQSYLTSLSKQNGEIQFLKNIQLNDAIISTNESDNYIEFATNREIIKYDKQGNIADHIIFNDEGLTQFGEILHLYHFKEFDIPFYYIDSLSVHPIENIKTLVQTRKGIIFITGDYDNGKFAPYNSIAFKTFENNNDLLLSRFDLSRKFIFKTISIHACIVNKTTMKITDSLTLKNPYFSNYHVFTLDKKNITIIECPTKH